MPVCQTGGMTGPSTLMIIRHGEKPADPPIEPPPHGVDVRGVQSPHSLLPKGWQRAGALVSVFTEQPAAPLTTPAVLFAPDYKHLVEFHRTSETITPLAHRLDTAIRTPEKKGDEAALIKHHVAPLDGDDVLICWEHHHIPALAQAFAAEFNIPDADLPAIARGWPEDDFWSVVVFTRGEDGSYTVGVTSEDALAGDPQH